MSKQRKPILDEQDQAQARLKQLMMGARVEAVEHLHRNLYWLRLNNGVVLEFCAEEVLDDGMLREK